MLLFLLRCLFLAAVVITVEATCMLFLSVLGCKIREICVKYWSLGHKRLLQK